MRILLLGRTETLFAAAEHARAAGHTITGVITARAAPESTKDHDHFRELAALCAAPFLLAQRLDERALALVAEARADVAISMNWVSVVEQFFIDQFPYGVLNAHFGDLPRYRGNAVPNWAILAEENEAVLTVHQMVGSELDTGPILAQSRIPISLDTTIGDLNAFMDAELPGLFAVALGVLIGGRILRSTSNDTAGFRCYPRLPRDGRIDWTQSARAIHAIVRASGLPFAGAFTFYRDPKGQLRKLIVWSSRLIESPSADRGEPGHVLRNDKTTGESWIMTGSGVLAITQAANGDEPANCFFPGRAWNSIRMRLGLEIESELYALNAKIEELRSVVESMMESR